MIQAVFNSDLGRLEAYSNGTLVAWKDKYGSVIRWTISGCSFNINWECCAHAELADLKQS